MTTAPDVLEDAGFDWESLDADEDIKATPGAMKGSRGVPGPRRGRRRSATTKKLTELQKRLSGEMFQAGAMIGMGLPTTGYYICQESDAFTKAVMQLAATRPEWVDALEAVANIQPGLVIGRTVIGIGASFAVDRHRIKNVEERQILKLLGVYQAYMAVHSESTGSVEGSAYKPPPAGSFVPVA